MKSYELTTGTQLYSVEFSGSNGQFDFLEISLVYDKSDTHTTIYDSYNLELVATHIQSLSIKNSSQTYSLSNEIKFDMNSKNNKYNLHRQFVAWSCDGSSVAPLSATSQGK